VDRLDEVRQSPSEEGSVELIVRRPAPLEREVVEEAELDLTEGLVGDCWRTRGSSRTPDGSANLDAQLTLMNARAAALLAGAREKWPLAGDQLYVDFDLSPASVPPGTRLELGSAVIEVTAAPHTGCGKFLKRFGIDAQKLVNSVEGRELNLRGINAKIVTPGTVRAGDPIRRVPAVH
jgi:hypothetical protein